MNGKSGSVNVGFQNVLIEVNEVKSFEIWVVRWLKLTLPVLE